MNSVAIVLAAGFSSRFRGHKLKAHMSSGLTVFQQTLRNVAAATDQLMVVTQTDLLHYAETSLAEALPNVQIKIVLNNSPHEGMGSSIAAGVRALAPNKEGPIAGCLLCLADMPFIRTESYAQLLQALEPQRIVVPTFQGRRGNPVGFGAQFFTKLGVLSADVGGKPILQAYPDQVYEIEIDDPGLVADIDTPEELQTYESELLP